MYMDFFPIGKNLGSFRDFRDLFPLKNCNTKNSSLRFRRRPWKLLGG